jgi:hypothetical protein
MSIHNHKVITSWNNIKNCGNLYSIFFVHIYIFILLEAMNKSVLEKLKCKARGKKLEKKTKVFRRK